MFLFLLKAATQINLVFELSEHTSYAVTLPQDVAHQSSDLIFNAAPSCHEFYIPVLPKMPQNSTIQTKMLSQYIAPLLHNLPSNILQSFDDLSPQEVVTLALYVDYLKIKFNVARPPNLWIINLLATTADKAIHFGQMIQDLPASFEVDLYQMSVQFLETLYAYLHRLGYPLDIKAALAFKEGSPEVYAQPEFHAVLAYLNSPKITIHTSNVLSCPEALNPLSFSLIRMPHLRSLFLQIPTRHANLDDFSWELQLLHRLTTLHLDNLFFSNPYDITRFMVRLTRLKSLNSLTLRGCLESGAFDKLINCLSEMSSLTALSLGNNLSTESVKFLADILSNIPLKRLSLKGTFKNAAIEALCITLTHHITTLEQMFLEGSFDDQVFPGFAERLATFQNLTSLCVGSPNLVHNGVDSLFTVLPRLNQLTGFGLSCGYISCHQRHLLIEGLSQCSKLTDLALCSGQGDGMLPSPSHTSLLPMLRSLVLSDCYSSVEGVERLVPSLTHLTHLTLLHFKDQNFSSLCHLKHLTSLKISGEISDSGALILAKVLEQIPYLSFVSVHGLFTEDSITALISALHTFRHLRHASIVTSALEHLAQRDLPSHIKVSTTLPGNCSFKSLHSH
jgi:hypothetical protein